MRPAPGRGPRPGPPSGGGPDKAPWGLAACTGQRERGMNAEVSHEAAPHLRAGNRDQAGDGHSHEPLGKPSHWPTPMPLAMETQCYHVTILFGNNLLMQSELRYAQFNFQMALLGKLFFGR